MSLSVLAIVGYAASLARRLYAVEPIDEKKSFIIGNQVYNLEVSVKREQIEIGMKISYEGWDDSTVLISLIEAFSMFFTESEGTLVENYKLSDTELLVLTVNVTKA